ncbi:MULTISPECIES: DedA family protein [Helcobacillus]|uniref:Membrane protein DedA with SNARE-associated domain n=1 Tax=Helcobacillus massiliensis TaxID=521392 RepID=A0A839QS99_9MICO|nr:MULTISPECIES: DedA family protein [Helcobacillus]MBB3022645.1 membrane protein DedA with SNARE-associated domain [Helcobacillus massiliensis]MCG7426421.1 DedA family protein [Helcobacillus sp. ACRRO]MDK7742374.1 DedA family protein [Helcobacillus massiliensis]WOO91990.1 DedA family protein [Helcobacillus massiliensis]
MTAWMHQLEVWIAGVADAWWIHLVMFACAFVDAFFPTVPSESVLVTLASLWSSGGTPTLWLLVPAAWVGAFLGDNLTFLIGRRVPLHRLRFLQRPKMQAGMEAAEAGLESHGFLWIMTARYIPFGRTAVNLSAGALGYEHRRFLSRSLVATFCWATYGAAVGAIAGQWFTSHRLIGVIVSLAVAVVLSLIIERLAAAVRARSLRHRRSPSAPGGRDDQ